MGMMAVAVAGLLSTVSGAWATTLGDLVTRVGTTNQWVTNGGSITVGDKIFSNFSYSFNVGTAANALLPGGINVNPLNPPNSPPAVVNEIGIQFQGGFTASANSLSDFLIGYTVSIVPASAGTFRITDADMVSNIDPSGTGIGFGKITETFTALVPPTPPILTQVTNFNFAPSGPNQPTGHTDFPSPGYTSIAVAKDIVLNNTGGTGAVALSFVDQQYSQTQTVPVPAAAWMGMSTLAGLGGLGVLRRRARKA